MLQKSNSVSVMCLSWRDVSVLNEKTVYFLPACCFFWQSSMHPPLSGILVSSWQQLEGLDDSLWQAAGTFMSSPAFCPGFEFENDTMWLGDFWTEIQTHQAKQILSDKIIHNMINKEYLGFVHAGRGSKLEIAV